MKRSLSFLTLLLLMSPFMHLHGQSGLRPRGDVNRDWEVTIADVNGLTDAIIAGTHYNSFYTYDHDINGDKEINIADVNLLIDALLGDELAPMPSFSGTVPVLYINTEGHRDITSKEEYLHADWWLDAMGIDGYESLGSAEHPLGMLIKGRGNYTWTLNKKPFRIKLDAKQKVLGMKSNRHFCLMAHATWNDFLTNTVGFELSRRIGLAYTPAQAPVEVVLNGQFIGLYFLTEKIEVGKNRVNIKEQENGDTCKANITGGWLLEIDDHPDDNQIGLYEGNGNWLAVKYHSPDSLSHEQLSYLYHLIRDANQAIYCPDKTSTKWEQYIDMDTLACFYIVNEVTDEIESFANSLFLHKQRGDSTKLMFGPVWDFGCSFGRAQNPATYFLYENTAPNFKAHWLEEILKYPRFQECVREHWNRFYPAQLEDIEDFIDDFVDQVSAAGDADAVRWPEYLEGVPLKRRSEVFYKPLLRAKVKFLVEQWSNPDVD
ncbi:MAG: CotH kinase family protein [Muribaculaceae bacterium]|nr:CotH kinase family protein [Muribaculaceae bacterium]